MRKKLIACIITVLEFTEKELLNSTVTKELLGKGGYGNLYKGYLRSTFVAVKYLTDQDY